MTEAQAPSPEALGFSGERLDRAYALVEGLVTENAAVGAAMLVGRGERSLAPCAFGRMGAPDAAPVRPDTIFAVASCTKPIVAAAVCLLVERGLVGLDQPVCELIPELSANLKEVRLSQLMTHTSGLGGLVRNRELRRTRQPLQRWLDALYRTTLEAPPGTRVRYTSAGAALLGDVVCRVSGVELRDFLAREFSGRWGCATASTAAATRTPAASAPACCRRRNWLPSRTGTATSIIAWERTGAGCTLLSRTTAASSTCYSTEGPIVGATSSVRPPCG